MGDPVQEFLTLTLSSAGGVVEDAPGGLQALLPPNVARRLGVPEEIGIHLSSAEPPGEGVLDGRIGSSFLERLVADRLERPAIAAVALPAGLPAPLPESLPVLLNAVRLGAAERRRTDGRFLAAEVRVTLQGEELRSAVVSLTIRLADGARTEAFRVSGAYPLATAPLDDRERHNARAALRSWLWREGPVVHVGALETLRRRARRDLEGMAEYYASLDAEMAKAAARARSDEERLRRYAKWAALPGDLDSRREQLRLRIRPRLAARMVAATLIESDVEQFEFAVRRRSREGSVTICHRTTDGVFEGPACASCGVATLCLYLCDERLHVLCEACGQAGRLDAARCRACRGSCPEQPTVSIDDPTARLRIGGSPQT
ncbi:MAG: hypothetical protein HY704_02695 [Gemmatimonadetes bacterium]|nr:hypothetical protein [Gemmatimonadota bacterium]